MILIMDWLGIGRLTEFNILKEPDRGVYCDFICPLMGNLNIHSDRLSITPCPSVTGGPFHDWSSGPRSLFPNHLSWPPTAPHRHQYHMGKRIAVWLSYDQSVFPENKTMGYQNLYHVVPGLISN